MRQARAKEEWLYDISWSWSDALPAQGNDEAKEKLQSLTLTMTHKPTSVSLIRTTSLVQIKRGKISQHRSQFWLDLFHELQQKVLRNQDQAV